MTVGIARHTLAASALAGCTAAAAPRPASPSSAATVRPSVLPATVVRSSPSPRPPAQPRVSISRVRTRDGALVTVATFLGTSALAGHTYRAASVAQLQSQPATVATTQRVTIVGHRTVRA